MLAGAVVLLVSGGVPVASAADLASAEPFNVVPMSAPTLSGTISAASASGVSVTNPRGQYYARITRSTSITVNGQPADASALRSGMRVTITFAVGADGEATDEARNISASK